MGGIEVPTSGKGFGGGEATRGPKPTEYESNDTKSVSEEHKLPQDDSYAAYLARRAHETDNNS